MWGGFLHIRPLTFVYGSLDIFKLVNCVGGVVGGLGIMETHQPYKMPAESNFMSLGPFLYPTTGSEYCKACTVGKGAGDIQ